MDFVEICNVCARKAIIKVAKRKINFDKICHSYSDLNFGVTFLEHSVFRLNAQDSFSCNSIWDDTLLICVTKVPTIYSKTYLILFSQR